MGNLEMDEIYNKLLKIRNNKEFSQELMAEKMNKTQSAYARIERGATKIDFDTLELFAKVNDLN